MKIRFDGPNKHIIITDKNSDGSVPIDIKSDIYSQWKEWMLEGNSQFLPAIRTVGGDPISDTVDVAPYFFLQNGWFLAPSGADFTANLTGNLYTDPASAAKVDAIYVTGKVLIETNLSNNALQVADIGGGGSATITPEDINDIADAVWDEDLTNHSAQGTAGETQKSILYKNSVVIDSTYGQSGTTWPIGTHKYPVNNLTDALVISTARNLDKIILHDDLTIEATHDVSNMSIETIGIMGTTITFTDGCSAQNSAFRYANLQGTISNNDVLLVESCTILNLNNFTGVMNVVAFGQGSEITLGSWVEIIQGTAGGESGNEPEISINGSMLNMSHWTGNLKLMNKDANNRTVVNCGSGNILIDSTCVSGGIQLLGTGVIESDNSGPNCQVDVDAFITNNAMADHVWDEQVSEHIANGSFGKLEQDVQDGLTRLLGLCHENIHIDESTYDQDNNLISARVRLYNNSADIGSNRNILAIFPSSGHLLRSAQPCKICL